jgi:phosphatidylserine/phosphatidylglycerophosphate/cardiolipin synthase-like enzyme
MNRLLFLFFISIAGISASQATESEKNKLIVCENGMEMFQWVLDFISSAEYSVEVLACFFGGETAQHLLNAIEQRLTEVPDLKVFILASSILLDRRDWEYIEALKACYPQNFHIEFSIQVPRVLPDIFSVDNHAKFCVVDGTYFSAGGTNFEERHCAEGTFKPQKNKKNATKADAILPSGMRDQDIVGKGPLAKELRRIFFQLYSIWENYNCTQVFIADPQKIKESSRFFEISAAPFVEAFETSDRVREITESHINLVLGGPHQTNNAITQEYLRLIREAEEEIILEHLYFLPIDPILNALIEAANRGVKITLITNGLGEVNLNGAYLFVWGNRMSYVPLFYGCDFHFWEACFAAQKPLKNTHIFEYTVEDVWLHKKMMLVDRRILVLGSYNLSFKSAYGDYEIILVLDSKEATLDALKIHERDMRYSKKITPEMARTWYFDPIISCWGRMQKNFSGLL